MKDTSLNKTIPRSAEAEAAILGAVLMDNRSLNECLSIIGPDDFYYDRNKIIFRALCELSDKGKPVDSVILKNFLKERGKLDKCGGAVYIAEVMDSVVSSANITHYSRIIKDKAVLRAVIATGEEIVKKAYEETGEEPKRFWTKHSAY